MVDDMGMRKLSATEAQDLCEILEERSIGKSTVFTTQLTLDHWSEVIGDPVIADAIRDRLEHAALTIQITGESYRGVKARKLASKQEEGRVRIVAFGSASDQVRWSQLVKSAGPQLGNSAS
jgi:IstB-like ATP binding protein